MVTVLQWASERQDFHWDVALVYGHPLGTMRAIKARKLIEGVFKPGESFTSHWRISDAGIEALTAMDTEVMQTPQIFPKSYPDTVGGASGGSTIFVDDARWHGDGFLVTQTLKMDAHTDADAQLIVRLSDGLPVVMAHTVPARIVALVAPPESQSGVPGMAVDEKAEQERDEANVAKSDVISQTGRYRKISQTGRYRKIAADYRGEVREVTKALNEVRAKLTAVQAIPGMDGEDMTESWRDGYYCAMARVEAALDTQETQSRATNDPKRGDLWRHYKGTTYKVIVVSEHSETGQTMVIYMEHNREPAKHWARPLSMWHEEIEDGVHRFERVAE